MPFVSNMPRKVLVSNENESSRLNTFFLKSSGKFAHFRSTIRRLASELSNLQSGSSVRTSSPGWKSLQATAPKPLPSTSTISKAFPFLACFAEFGARALSVEVWKGHALVSCLPDPIRVYGVCIYYPDNVFHAVRLSGNEEHDRLPRTLAASCSLAACNDSTPNSPVKQKELVQTNVAIQCNSI